MVTYTCHRTIDKITVDGNLDELSWQKAQPINLVENVEGGKPKQVTIAKMLWDDQYLYMGFYCEDKDIWATISERDGNLWDEEVVEAFIDPDSDEISYVEIEVNPLNNVVDLFVLNRSNRETMKTLFDWDSRLISAVKVDGVVNSRKGTDRSWTVEIAFPWSDFDDAPNLPPEDGDSWRLNLYRIDRPKEQEWELSALSPTGEPNFHIPRRFGKVVFSKEPVG